jgi:DNA-binding phage protein
MRFRPTLAALGRAARFLSLTAVAQAAGIPRQTLFTRLRRGGPELSDVESAAVTDELTSAGIVLEN